MADYHPHLAAEAHDSVVSIPSGDTCIKAYPSKHELAVESHHLAPVSFEIKMAWLTLVKSWGKYLSKVVAFRWRYRVGYVADRSCHLQENILL
jgi:hypothetical protein